MLQREEFASWANDEGVHDDWMGDDGLDREAFNERLHHAWDTNRDGVVTENEWRAGAETLYRDSDYGTWQDWDADGDSELDLNEVREGHERHGLYDRIDGDQDLIIDDEELGDFFFDLFDENGDDALDTTEWDRGRQAWFERRDDAAMRRN